MKIQGKPEIVKEFSAIIFQVRENKDFSPHRF